MRERDGRPWHGQRVRIDGRVGLASPVPEGEFDGGALRVAADGAEAPAAVETGTAAR